MTPRVPSDPMKSCFRSYPVLSLRRPRSAVQIRPIGKASLQDQGIDPAYSAPARQCCLRSEIPADLSGPLGSERKREKAPFLLNGFMKVFKNDTGFNRHRVIHGIDILNLVQTAERQQDGVPGIIRIEPPTSVVPPAYRGTTGVRASLAIRTTRERLLPYWQRTTTAFLCQTVWSSPQGTMKVPHPRSEHTFHRPPLSVFQ